MSMADRELLELAAKASGIPRPVDDNGAWSAWVGSPENGHWWNPLEDDGDCLRMALDLNLQVRFNYPSQIGQNCRIEANRIRCAAYRRAAVEMAAEIGKSMQEGKS